MAERKMKVWRIRLITEHGNATRLVRAKSKERALAHIGLTSIEIAEATADDAVALGVAGGKIEDCVE